YYAVPDSLNSLLTDRDYIEIAIPIGYAQTNASTAYVPLEAVYQTQDAASLFIAEKGKAVSRHVVLGNVYGGYVSVVSGLKDGDQVIVTRNVVEGDRVEF